ncbi:BspA family leucine-rich repeat surface protein [Costertonia aggregata]|uniref:BspA family leucine-rich repeat surface protein n=1 Tax=Costertonia aggregata TaxID=343403 RepID=A0A7H9AR81_9FLAO|nr:BspA family leucine-rich repeat surface protein [Costertonia aggregata]QLG45755.1 BspA family leucine-rich repeat surface protein [Costertonia aggregata]
MLKKLFLSLAFLCTVINYGQDFTAIWNTVNVETGSSATNQVTIPTNPAFTTYNYDVDWGDGTSDTGVTGNITHTYLSGPGTYTISISGDFPAIYFNDEEANDKLKIEEILQWGTIQWQTMENAFYGCTNLNFDAIDSPDLSNVTTLESMFRGCTSFNGIVNNWDVNSIENMSGLFADAVIFNRPLDSWTTNAVTNMSETFLGARLFNEPLDNWRVDNVVDMSGMFSSAGSFNQNISNWNTLNVQNMSSTFRYTSNFNQPLNNWRVDNVTDMSNMFEGSAYNLPLDNWSVANVTNMSGMFSQYSRFNQNINNWTVNAVTDMSQMFHRATSFNQPLNDWDVSNVINMNGMFDGFFVAMIFNQPLNDWDVSKVEDMGNMFRDCPAFDQPLNLWVVDEVANMSGMFEKATVFNQDITGWNVDKVENMSNMFRDAQAFNQPINTWTPTAITNMSGMFSGARQFNQPLDSWDVSQVANFSNIFQNATLFNQDISNWITDSATNMAGMFQNATAFNLDLGSWNISGVTSMANMLSNSGLSQSNYDNTLIGWAGQTVRDNVNLGATSLNYCDALDERQDLIDDSSWNITGDIVNCSFVLCTNLISPIDGDTNVPASANLTWAQTPGATGYYVTVVITRGGSTSTPFNDIQVAGGSTTGLDLEDGVGNDLLQSGDEVSVTVVPYNDTDGRATGCTAETFTVVPSWVNSPDAFKFTIDTRNLDRNSSGINQLRLEHNTNYRNDYNYSVDWGDDQFDNNVTNEITHTYPSPGIYTVSIIGDYPAHYYGSSGRDNLKLLSVDQWGTYVWKSMRNTFYFCENMVYNAADVPDLSQVTTMQSMFRRTYNSNGNINNWDVSNVENMSNMFYQASIYNQPMDSWNVSNVTSMAQMFNSASAFNQPIGTWNVGNVENMYSMFYAATSFDQPLNAWDVLNVTDMSYMFNAASSFNQPLNDWDVDNVTNMTNMFSSASSFDQPLDQWDVDEVINMSSMFNSAAAFNQNLNDWDVDKVTSMASMFSGASSYNQPMDQWNVTTVTNMSSMFQSATVFNQNINGWEVTNVLNMFRMFRRALAYNQPMHLWDVNSVVNMSSMFDSAETFNQPLDSWDVSAVANMSSMFSGALVFDQPLDSWEVSSVTLMPFMFDGAAIFNRDINTWNVASVTNMAGMFREALVFDQPLQSWNTGEALNMEEMFRGATAFNRPIDSWNTSFVTTMKSMFEDATTFNQSLNSWNVASVTTMEDMFDGATAFNGEIGAWNVRAVTTMREMFKDAVSFNQDINNWRVANVTNMDRMFNEAIAYNQPMDLWNLGDVTMAAAFFNATSLNQYFGDWDVSGVSNMNAMLGNTALTRENYDNTLIAWSEQTLTNGITLGATGLPYCDAEEERQSMIDNFGWTFDGDIRDCPIPECTILTSPLNGDTDIPVNTNITWEPALYARGYRLTVGTSPGGNDIVDNETINNETSYEFTSDFDTGDIVYVTLIPFNDEGDAVGPCTEESFTISSNPATIPNCTNLLSPTNDDDDVAVTTDLSWDPISNADGYRITVGTTAGGNELVDDEDVGNNTTYEFGVDLPEDTAIFVTIIPYNDEGDATGCREESFTTELIPVPPVCSGLISPANNETDVPIDTNLSWTAVPNATGYLVVVGTTSGGIEVANNIDVGPNTTYDITNDLQEDRLHYVTIIPYNDEGDATGCVEETFTTGNSTSPPSCVLLATPADNATAVPLDTNLSWNGSSSADGYRLTVGTTSGGTEIFTGDIGDITTYDLTDDLPEGTMIFVNITAYNVNGDSTGCTEQTFMTDGPPECTTLVSPINGATDVPVNTTIEWAPSTNADGYRLTVSGSSVAANNLTDVDVTTATDYTFPDDFNRGETITVTITPYNDMGDATACTSESFTTIPPPLPLCTALATPADGSVDVAVDTNIEWVPSANATGYRLSVLASSSTANNLTNLDITSGNSYDFSNNFEQGETVQVTIVPYNAVGEAIGCISERFTIKPVPTCTSLTLPTNASTNIALDTDLAWTPIPDATGYRITVLGSDSSANNVSNLDITTGNTYDFPTDFRQGETVSVTIVPYNEVGDAIGCNTESFTIESVPDCTSLTLPLNGSTDIAVDSDIEWTQITGANGYRLTVTASNSTVNTMTDVDVTIGTSYNFSNDFEQGETVTVSIVPYNDAGNAFGCSSESFTIKAVPSCTNLIAPLNGDVIATTNSISWNGITDADGYKITVSASNTTLNNITDFDTTNTSYNFPSNFDEGEVVTVTITPYNEVGDAIGCTSESFTIRPLPTCTTLLAPLNNATQINVATDISWNASSHADGYRLSVGTTPNGTDIVDNEDVASLTNYVFAESLPSETMIYVTVIPYNTSGDAVGCTFESFETEIIAPECTILSNPVNGETEVALDTSISWEEVEKTDGYRLSIGTTPLGTDILDNRDMGLETSYIHGGEFPFDTLIYVTVTPYNSVGDAQQCVEQSFTTIIPEDETKYGFSPDGDGINEYWHIENIQYYPENVVTIYNRWGDAVFSIENYDNDSQVFQGDANLKTKMGAGRLPEGTYFFNIQIEGETILRKTEGFLVIKR